MKHKEKNNDTKEYNINQQLKQYKRSEKKITQKKMTKKEGKKETKGIANRK